MRIRWLLLEFPPNMSMPAYQEINVTLIYNVRWFGVDLLPNRSKTFCLFSCKQIVEHPYLIWNRRKAHLIVQRTLLWQESIAEEIPAWRNWLNKPILLIPRPNTRFLKPLSKARYFLFQEWFCLSHKATHKAMLTP